MAEIPTRRRGGARARSESARKCQETLLARMMEQGLPEERVLALIAALYARALERDLGAARLLLSYRFGRPAVMAPVITAVEEGAEGADRDEIREIVVWKTRYPDGREEVTG